MTRIAPVRIVSKTKQTIVVQDLATQWIQPYPCKTKTSQETQRSSQKFLEPDRKPKVIYTDNGFGTRSRSHPRDGQIWGAKSGQRIRNSVTQSPTGGQIRGASPGNGFGTQSRSHPPLQYRGQLNASVV